MSRRKIDKVAPVSPMGPTTKVDVGQTISIVSDPDGRWVAARQSVITPGLQRRSVTHTIQQDREPVGFSGESKRIGKWAWDEKTPIGKRSGSM
jgi:hypothetical protein